MIFCAFMCFFVLFFWQLRLPVDVECAQVRLIAEQHLGILTIGQINSHHLHSIISINTGPILLLFATITDFIFVSHRNTVQCSGNSIQDANSVLGTALHVFLQREMEQPSKGEQRARNSIACFLAERNWSSNQGANSVLGSGKSIIWILAERWNSNP